MDNGPGVMIPITTVVVTKKNLKTGGSLPKANPFRIFAGKNYLSRYRFYV